MNPENESKPIEPILQRRLNMMASVFLWWQNASAEERVAVTRIVIEQERLEAELADAQAVLVDAQAA